MPTTFLILLLFPFFSLSQDIDIEAQENIEIILGIDKTIQLDFAASPKIEVGNEAVINYTLIPSKQQITLKGITPGTSSINIRNRVGDIRKRLIVTVTATDQSAIVQKLRAHFEDIEGLTINIIEGDVVVGGMIFVPKDIGRIVAILSREEFSNVIRLIELSPQTQLLIAKRMQDEIQAMGYKDVTVRVLNGTFVLEGIVTSDAARNAVEKRAQLLLPEKLASLAQQFQATQELSGKLIISNDIGVNPKNQPQPIPKLIKVTAQFVELIRQYNNVFGFSWRPLATGDGGSIRVGRGPQREGQSDTGGITSASSDTLTAVISNLFPKLNSAKSAGYARVIQSGVVIVKNNTPASITKNNTDTVITPGDNPISTNITTGFTVEVQPNILEKENIELNVSVNVGATLDSNTSGSNKTQQNTVKTILIVKSKESAAIGGILQKSTSTDFDKDFPGVNDTIEASTNANGEAVSAQSLFSFVKSKNYTEGKSQFVVFVTPEIIENASNGVQDIRRKFRKRRL